jgi:hypothetical protein
MAQFKRDRAKKRFLSFWARKGDNRYQGGEVRITIYPLFPKPHNPLLFRLMVCCQILVYDNRDFLEAQWKTLDLEILPGSDECRRARGERGPRQRRRVRR